MSRISVKKLRKGFVMVVSEEDLTAFVEQFEGLFTSVQLGAVSMTEERTVKKWAAAKSWSGHHAGVATAERVRGTWKVELELCSVREETIGEEAAKVTALLLNDLEVWLEEKRALSDEEPDRGYKIFLEWNRNRFSGELESASFNPAGYR